MQTPFLNIWLLVAYGFGKCSSAKNLRPEIAKVKVIQSAEHMKILPLDSSSILM